MENALKYGPKILQYLKTSSDLSNQELLELLGTKSTSVMNKVLRGEQAIDIGAYYSLQEKYKFNTDAIMKGSFKMNDPVANEIFKMPSKWKESQFSSGKILNVYINFFDKTFGSNKFQEFCQFYKIDPLYFFNTSNPINMEFIQRMLQELAIKNKSNLNNLVNNLSNYTVMESDSILKEISFKLNKDFERTESLVLISKFFNEIGKLEQNHTYKIEEENENEVIMSMQPNKHINMPLWATDNLIGGFMDLFLPKFLSKAGIIHECNIETKERAKKIGDKSIFKVTKK